MFGKRKLDGDVSFSINKKPGQPCAPCALISRFDSLAEQMKKCEKNNCKFNKSLWGNTCTSVDPNRGDRVTPAVIELYKIDFAARLI